MNVYDKLYQSNNSFWGTEISNAAKELAVYLNKREGKNQSILEIGCGEGRDSIFLAQQGFDVTAIDSSKEGIRVLQKKMRIHNIQINTFAGNVEDYVFEQEFDAIFSIGTLHYVDAFAREDLFHRFKTHTKVGGINIISVFCKKPFVKEMRSEKEVDNLFVSGELMYYYQDWEILRIEEKIKECNSNNIPHRHVKDSIIAKRVL